MKVNKTMKVLLGILSIIMGVYFSWFRFVYYPSQLDLWRVARLGEMASYCLGGACLFPLLKRKSVEEGITR